MNIFLKDLVNIADQKTYDVNIDYLEVENNVFLRALKDVEGDFTFYYDIEDKLRVNYSLVGKMICPDAITLEDVDVDFDLNEDILVSNDTEVDGLFLDSDCRIEDLLLQIVMPEVPIKVVKNKKIEYSRGDGWSFVSEDEFDSNKKEQLDPRLQKLKEYKFEEDD
ncbi:MAG: hypothetical protein KBT35_01735 [Firmicutes bacterium]|nr:hypothetical protein [Candidatus Colivicinus equi]